MLKLRSYPSMALALSAPPLATAHVGTWDFITNIFTNAFSGDLLAIVVLSILALLILKFIVARWVFTLVKQIVIFGGLAFAVWFGSRAIGVEFGRIAELVVLIVGGAVVTVLFFIMLYMFFLRRGREKAALKAGMSQEEARNYAYGKGANAMKDSKGTGMRIGAGSLQRQGLPVHYQKSGKATAAGGGGGGSAGGASRASAPADEEESRLEETLKKMNILGATKQQNLLTVSVLILVAQFGVFTSRTVSAPTASVGTVLFAIFLAAATIFVMTAYDDRMKGLVHFVYATIFALALSGLLLVYWVQTFDCSAYGNAQAISDACANGAQEATITWGTVLQPRFYFASEGLIAMITGVAFSTLLTKGGG